MYQNTIPCPHCGHQNLHGTWVCAACGFTLLVYCPHCQAGNETGSQFCQYCGSSLAGPGQAPVQQPPGAGQPQQYYQPDQPYEYQAPSVQQSQQQYPYQQEGYQQYDPYRQPGPAYSIGGLQDRLDNFVGRLKQLTRTTNPILLSSLVVLVVGLTVFLVLAFQLGWIKTGEPPKQTSGPTDTTPPMILMLQVKEGSSPHSAIITWSTSKPSSTQVEYGIWPYANTTTPVTDMPIPGVNSGSSNHQVGLTNLLPKTSYVYRAISIDKDGNKAVSPEMRFDTTP